MRLRLEIIQSNKAVGFQNFQLYQKRKDIFLYGNYESAYVRMALGSALQHKSMKSLEVRFFPNPQNNEFKKDIKNFWRISTRISKMEKLVNGSASDRTSFDSSNHPLFFVPHLIKKPDNSKLSVRQQLGTSVLQKSRHYDLQIGEYSNQINNIISMRQSSKYFAQRIYAIDAANHEFDARPEVFAYLFRKARYESSSNFNHFKTRNVLPKLQITYHVGEDFFDITSGLRAIDEAIKFLNLSHGDRLGHALALGVEPSEFYDFKSYKVFLSRQELLDNLVWLSFSLKTHGLFDNALESWINNAIEEHFAWLYRASIPLSSSNHSVTINTYINAWHLRGDNPEYYFDVDNKNEFVQKIRNSRRPYDLLQDDFCRGIREKDKQACQLMHHYHYNYDVRIKGAEIVTVEIPEGFAKIIRDLQDAMLEKICHLGIGIETNPSSNYLIGTFRKYHKHPIVRFYNRWLVPTPTSPQAFVSINTDDQGVFDTDLENEYALMSSALENAKDNNGKPLYKATDILRWLSDIRIMGMEQSFMLTHKHLSEGR